MVDHSNGETSTYNAKIVMDFSDFINMDDLSDKEERDLIPRM